MIVHLTSKMKVLRTIIESSSNHRKTIIRSPVAIRISPSTGTSTLTTHNVAKIQETVRKAEIILADVLATTSISIMEVTITIIATTATFLIIISMADMSKERLVAEGAKIKTISSTRELAETMLTRTILTAKMEFME